MDASFFVSSSLFWPIKYDFVLCLLNLCVHKHHQLAKTRNPLYWIVNFRRTASAVNCILHAAGKFRRTKKQLHCVSTRRGPPPKRQKAKKERNRKDRDTYSMNLWPGDKRRPGGKSAWCPKLDKERVRRTGGEFSSCQGISCGPWKHLQSHESQVEAKSERT